jgi:hypothetical protein
MLVTNNGKTIDVDPKLWGTIGGRVFDEILPNGKVKKFDGKIYDAVCKNQNPCKCFYCKGKHRDNQQLQKLERDFSKQLANGN